MSPKNFDYFGLAETGSLVWDLIDGHRTVGEILSILQGDFDGETEVMRTDVVDFLSALQASGLIEERD